MTDKLLYAKYLVRGEGILVRDGGIHIHDGIIRAVGDWKSIKNNPGDVEEFPQSILLPGLINSHTHLEIPGPMGRPMRFIPWLQERIKHNQGDFDPTQTVRAGVRACLEHGVTCVGDIASRVKPVREVLMETPLRGISFGEIRAMGKRREGLASAVDALVDRNLSCNGGTPQPARAPAARMGIGLSPHAPYSVEVSGYRRIVKEGLPIATHLAESDEEQAFLENHEGAFRELWKNLPWWDDQIERFTGSPVQLAKAVGLLDAKMPVLLVHLNYCSDADLDLLEKSKATVVYCPRTHQFFGHAPHRFKEMRARGINVVLGTDSLASTEDLDLMEEVRVVHQMGVGAMEALGMVTWYAGRNFGKVGQIENGFHADIAMFEVSSDKPLEDLMASRGKAQRVMISGELARRDA